jgi:hypothetical protein
MKESTRRSTRRLRIIAQDPSVRVNGKILTAHVDVPAEELAPGPWGYRVHVIDYDASTGTLYKPLEYPRPRDGAFADPFETTTDRELLSSPGFHAQNAYAIVMRILARFEFALGRRVSWGFGGHQLKVAPHAFADANAYYSKKDEGLFFGYFPGRKGTVFACLSHDVVAHETTHALVDGLRERYVDPSSPDQAAFHEGFADVVALLSIFALREVVGLAIDLRQGSGSPQRSRRRLIAREDLTPEALRRSTLLGLAEQIGQELSAVRGQALRRSVTLEPSPRYIDEEKYPEFVDPHRRGEILVAAMLNAFLDVWGRRLATLGEITKGRLDRSRVVEEGANAADYLLTMAIRALDYSTPVHMEFCDYLSALLTADHEIRPDDSTYQFRRALRESFAGFGLTPSSGGIPEEPGVWLPPRGTLFYDRTRFESMTRDPDEVFRFIWENRKVLGLYEGVYTKVLSVRPCLRIGPDGFFLRETVADYIQEVKLKAEELKRFSIEVPDGMPLDTELTLYGGATLIFDEYGRLKFNIANRLDNAQRQTTRLNYLWRYGFFNKGSSRRRSFAAMHRQRSLGGASRIQEEWW